MKVSLSTIATYFLALGLFSVQATDDIIHNEMLTDVLEVENNNGNLRTNSFVDFQSGLGASECQVAGYLRSAGFPENIIPAMVCTAKYESSFNCGATNRNTDGSTDYGLFQFNSYYWCSGDAASKHNGCGTSCQSLFDCSANARCAKTVYNQQGLDAWYAYKSHRGECDNYRLNC